jgi:8-oxo-dGTP diphosphatase
LHGEELKNNYLVLANSSIVKKKYYLPMKVRPAICIRKKNKILLMRYEYNGKSVYNLPGGNPEPKETLTHTLERELIEELGIEIRVGKILLMGEVSLLEQKEDVLHCIFDGKIAKNEPILNAEETSAKELVWLTIESLSDIPMYPNVGKALLEKLQNEETEVYVGRINQQWY